MTNRTKTLLTVVVSTFMISSCCGTKCKETTTMKLCDTNATQESANLFANMQNLIGKGTMIGHQDALAYGIGWFEDASRCDFREVAGDYPAVFGWDIGHIELGNERNLDSVKFSDMKEYIRKAYNSGGINSLSWHANNPITGGTTWDVTSKEVVASILPGGQNHTLYMEWLGRVADFMLDLKGDNGELIPVIFRPYHELSGSWFWWGQELCSKEQYVELWRMTVDYLRQDRDVHNMILSFSMAGYDSVEAFMERYPGDEYVDMIGFDAYQMKPDTTGVVFMLDVQKRTRILKEVAAQTGKIPAITELGYEGVDDSLWYSNVLLPLVEGQGMSYVLLWRNAYTIPGHFYASHPGHKSADDLVKFVSREDIITASETGGIYDK